MCTGGDDKYHRLPIGTWESYDSGPIIAVTMSEDDLTLPVEPACCSNNVEIESDYTDKSVPTPGIEGDGSLYYITLCVDSMAKTFTSYGADSSNAVVLSVAVPHVMC